KIPAGGGKGAGEDHGGGCGRERRRLVNAAPDRGPDPHPDRGQHQSGGGKRDGSQGDIEPDQPVLELGDHRGRRVTRRPLRAAAGIGRCSSSLSAPVWRSAPTARMATNGSRNAAATSQALNVGAQTPTSGENASPTPPAVPFKPLSSAYVRTALMNATPTSGPIVSSRIHHDRDATSSRHSFSSSQTKGDFFL